MTAAMVWAASHCCRQGENNTEGRGSDEVSRDRSEQARRGWAGGDAMGTRHTVEYSSHRILQQSISGLVPCRMSKRSLPSMLLEPALYWMVRFWWGDCAVVAHQDTRDDHCHGLGCLALLQPGGEQYGGLGQQQGLSRLEQASKARVGRGRCDTVMRNCHVSGHSMLQASVHVEMVRAWSQTCI